MQGQLISMTRLAIIADSWRKIHAILNWKWNGCAVTVWKTTKVVNFSREAERGKLNDIVRGITLEEGQFCYLGSRKEITKDSRCKRDIRYNNI